MFVYAGPGFKVYCDYSERKLRIAENLFSAVPGLKEQWKEVTAFSDFESWNASKYCTKVINPQVQEDIQWFWMDMEHPPEPGPQENS